MEKRIKAKIAFFFFFASMLMGAAAYGGQHVARENVQPAHNPEVENDEAAPSKKCRPVVHPRYPPYMPRECENMSGDEHFVRIVFDINEYGETENIRVLDYSNVCLVDASKRQVSRWLYNCEGANRKDVETEITFSRG